MQSMRVSLDETKHDTHTYFLFFSRRAYSSLPFLSSSSSCLVSFNVKCLCRFLLTREKRPQNDIYTFAHIHSSFFLSLLLLLAHTYNSLRPRLFRFCFCFCFLSPFPLPLSSTTPLHTKHSTYSSSTHIHTHTHAHFLSFFLVPFSTTNNNNNSFPQSLSLSHATTNTPTRLLLFVRPETDTQRLLPSQNPAIR